MDLCRGQLSINQAARPLRANTAQVGLGETFSWPPPDPTPPPLAQVLLRPFWGKHRTGRGRSPGAGGPANSPAGFGGFLASKSRRAGSECPTPTPARTSGLRAAFPWVRGAALAVGCVSLSLSEPAAPAVWPKPSGIFNWKLILRLDRRPRQRRATHPHPRLIPEDTRQEPCRSAL